MGIIGFKNMNYNGISTGKLCGSNISNVNIERIKILVELLNKARYEYYNKDNEIMTDKEYDDLFDELSALENETGCIMSNSPTQTVGYIVNSKLQKVKHTHPMLSLDKTKSVEDLKKFINKKASLLMLKMDGLTISLTYEDGKLAKAETRGNGVEGELITDNAKMFKNIPLSLGEGITGQVVIDGEAIITYNDFEKINEKLGDSEKKYKTPRNLASGSVRQLDTKIVEERNVRFVAWKYANSNIKSFETRLETLKDMGFDVVPFVYYNENDSLENIEDDIENLKEIAKSKSYPIDGLVITYDDTEYGESLGITTHHPRHSLAFKFYDEEVETTLLDIEWSPSRTGLLNPVAIFDPVEIDGTTVSRASLHNLSIIEDLLGKPYVGQKITVCKSNMIIPYIISAEKV